MRESNFISSLPRSLPTGRNNSRFLPQPAALVRRRHLHEIPEDLQCPLCYDNAISCQPACRHSFCWYCLHNYTAIKLKMEIPCPLCRRQFSLCSLKSLEGNLLERVNQLIVACQGENDGCKLFGPLGEIEIHEKICPRMQVMCCFRYRGCFYVASRKNMAAHTGRCRYNPDVHPCKYQMFGCKTRGTADLMEHHEPRCCKRNMGKVVSCPNKAQGCGLRLKKYYLANHIHCCPFKLSKKPAGSKKFAFELSFSWKNNATRHSHERMKEDFSKVFPNVTKVKEGNYPGEIRIRINNMPLAALKGMMLTCSPYVSPVLSDLNISRVGVNAFLDDSRLHKIRGVSSMKNCGM
ncbi:zinc finger, C3HC4 type (RING finger) domain-containing protein [Cardiosporidium cionae]|uniref:Zinc finger, C3HC4 type (RING finger) domain-containing protein n=1 Tax=Cardiosporidium cionae TaxID=476202 RepID=A0ABQ7J557_9APIC|nr:zinc finger, C3HC4 type (RING finger) domain-containing protein [Cardiosporidium cionae]|eukprot:KAF8817911.1 zinc finger, C3HC4 type (RING finger) domain-containing protein [Cardiosporidium cionae]